MKIKILLFTVASLFLVQCTSSKLGQKPPKAQPKPVVDNYFGKSVTDPYRYLEDLKDTTVVNWLKEQSDYSRQVLNSIPGRSQLIEKMKEFDQRKSSRIYSLDITDNDRYFYLKMTPKDNVGKLYFRDGLDGEEKLLYDPADFSRDSTVNYVISSVLPTDDGKMLAFVLAPNGSENGIMQLMDVDSHHLYPEQIDRCWSGPISWLPDGKSLLYHRMQSNDVHDPDREKNSKTYVHVVGTDANMDKDVFSREKYPELGIKPEQIPILYYDRDSHYLFGYLSSVDNRMDVVYAPATELKKDKITWKRLFQPTDSVYNMATTEKDIYVYTPKSAPNFKLLKMPIADPDLSKAETVVPENPDAKLSSFNLTKDALYYTLTRDGVEETAYRLPYGEQQAKKLDLPFAAGSISMSSKGINFDDIWLNMSGWTNDNKRYRYLPDEDQFELETLSSPAEYPEYDNLKVVEAMVPSHDGVELPVSIIYDKELKMDGSNPVFIYGYGAYGISMNPFFSPNFLLPTLHGCIMAVAHVRGGGELGNAWHRAGFKQTKPNTWKDLIATAEYLVKENYTSPKKIAINGGSAGGILIGRAMTERPDLFAAAIPEVGVLNPLRAEESPNGPVNVPEFGTVKDSAECMALLEMDSYHHIQDGVKYPATLVTAGMNDPRVIAWEPAKFAARLQNANTSDNPILLLVDFSAGHGIGNTKTKRFEATADVFSFALWQTGVKDFQPE